MSVYLLYFYPQKGIYNLPKYKTLDYTFHPFQKQAGKRFQNGNFIFMYFRLIYLQISFEDLLRRPTKAIIVNVWVALEKDRTSKSIG